MRRGFYEVLRAKWRIGGIGEEGAENEGLFMGSATQHRHTT
jgi:hypothetical protein